MRTKQSLAASAVRERPVLADVALLRCGVDRLSQPDVHESMSVLKSISDAANGFEAALATSVLLHSVRPVASTSPWQLQTSCTMKHSVRSSFFPGSQHHRSCQASMDVSLVIQRPRFSHNGLVQGRLEHNLAVRTALVHLGTSVRLTTPEVANS